jgi:hypothetical protein
MGRWVTRPSATAAPAMFAAGHGHSIILSEEGPRNLTHINCNGHFPLLQLALFDSRAVNKPITLGLPILHRGGMQMSQTTPLPSNLEIPVRYCPDCKSQQMVVMVLVPCTQVRDGTEVRFCCSNCGISERVTLKLPDSPAIFTTYRPN